MGDNLRKWAGTGTDVGLKIIVSHKIAATVPQRLVASIRAATVDAYEARKQEAGSIF